MKYLEHHFNSLHSIDLQFNKPISIAINSYLKDHKNLGSSDRFVLKELVYNYLRNKLLIEELNSSNNTLSKFMLAIFFWNPLASLSGRKLKTYNNLKTALDSDLIQNSIDILFSVTNPDNHELRYSYQSYMYDSLKNATGSDNFVYVLKKLHTFAPITVRKVTQSTKIKFEPKAELNFSGSNIFKDSYHTYSEFDLNILPKDIKKNLTVQDDGSRYIANICNPHSKIKILDACSGSGGKAIALSYLAPSSQIIAFDKDKRKVEKLSSRVKELGISNIFTIRESELDKMVGSFDLVLVDAPCTGSGTIRRFPEKKYTVTKELANTFSEKQFDILSKYSNFVKSGGQLVYSTCSFLTEENQGVTNKFLQANSQFTPAGINHDLENVDLKKALPVEGYSANLFPVEFDGDSFFVAKFNKSLEA